MVLETQYFTVFFKDKTGLFSCQLFGKIFSFTGVSCLKNM